MLDAELAAVALTSRLVDAPVKPLSSKEFWELSRRTDLSALRGRTATDVAAELGVSDEVGERIAGLFDRATALAFALEDLDHSGIWTITSVGGQYPKRLRDRLGDAAPVVLHGVGNSALLDDDGVGVVGSRDVSEEGSRVACAVAEIAAKAGLSVVSGAARGVDSDAMNHALEFGGQVVGVLADSLEQVISRPGIRRAVMKNQICLITPYGPAAPFSVGNAMGRNKLIYGLSRCTVVVASDHEAGGTWAGAVEALKNSYGRVASWTGPGSGVGNSALVEQGAVELSDEMSLSDLLREPAVPAAAKGEPAENQLTLGF